MSRTIGLPIGPEPWMAESAGTLDIMATFLELVLVAGSLALLRLRAHGDVVDPPASGRSQPSVEVAEMASGVKRRTETDVRR
jgi:hypothetical protein